MGAGAFMVTALKGRFKFLGKVFLVRIAKTPYSTRLPTLET